jgi:exopolysaccharide biosynthesis polyprenyl glycosylphosphotransferase
MSDMAVATTVAPPLVAQAPAPPPAPAVPYAVSGERTPAWSRLSRRSVPAARLVAAVDVMVVCGALLMVTGPTLAEWPAGLREFLSLQVSVRDLGLLLACAATSVAAFELAGLYEAALVRRRRDEMWRVVAGTAIVAAVAALLIPATGRNLPPFALPLFWAASLAGVATARMIRSRSMRCVARPRRVLVVGSGPHALRICRELSVDPLTCYQVLGFIDTSQAPRSPFVARRTLGSLDDLESILAREHIDEVHVGLPVRSHYLQIQQTIRVCERIGVKVMYGADIFGTELARPRVGGAASPRVELLVVAEGWPVAVKRAIDIVGAALAVIVLSPVMLAAALAVRLTSQGPIIYAQERYGLNRRRFRMFKFRTMVQDAERLQATLEDRNEAQGPVFKIANDPRVTPIGRWLRRTSIDELPQLFNVLRGDMSLVGPRPLPLRDVGRFTQSTDMRRFSVRPGITGLWQVTGRSRLGFDQWIKLDLHYIDRWSLALDARILARTIPAVLRGTGAA